MFVTACCHFKLALMTYSISATGKRDRTILCSLPGAHVADISNACLLGVPIGSIDFVSAAVKEKANSLEVVNTLGERLEYLFAHDALNLIYNLHLCIASLLMMD